nr:reverse transcriptase domain-containing protein [Tanacetum cinerariifolium]
MSADSAVTYTSVHFEARSWSIPSEDPYAEAAQQLLEQAPRSLEYVPDPIELEDHVPLHIPEHPKDLVPAEDEAPIEAYISEVASVPTLLLPPSFLSLRTLPLLPIPLPVPSTSCRAEILEADTLPRKRLLLTVPKPGCEVGESSASAAARQPGPTMARSVDCSFLDTMETRFRDTERRMMTALEMVNMRVLRRERLAYEQESIKTHEALARSKAYSRALVAVLETQARHHEWQRQTADDLDKSNGCYECEAQGHFKRNCPKLKNNNRGNQGENDNAQARVYAVGNTGANPDNVVADHHYNVEIAYGRIIGLNTIMRDCTLNFLNHPFNIDLMPVELGSFDVIIGMDWLSRYNVVIACAEKLMRIPFGDEILTIRGEGRNERNESQLNIISCSNAQEYMWKGCHVFLANITSTKDEDKSKGKRLEDVPVV